MTQLETSTITHKRGAAAGLVVFVVLLTAFAARPAAGDSAVAISIGGHSCAITTEHALKCWGQNQEGQIGDGTTTRRLTPVDVRGMSRGVIRVSAAPQHTCAIKTGGAVKCWGSNASGQLGDGTPTWRTIPTQVAGLSSGVTAIATGAQHSCAVLDTGRVKCWGDGSVGQIGDGQMGDAERRSPVDVLNLQGVVAISAAEHHSCALTRRGAVKCWGNNQSGQLGNGNRTNSAIPVDVRGLSRGVSAISVGWGFSCALLDDRSVKCWGLNSRGELGLGETTLSKAVPQQVKNLTSGTVAYLAAGMHHSCAIDVDGGVLCWGWNEYGQIGDGTLNDRYEPTPLPRLRSGVAAVSTNGSHSCALLDNGQLRCWGRNPEGQIGDGTTRNRIVPVRVQGFD